MIGWLVQRRLTALEKQFGVSVDYLRQMAALSRGAFCRFAMILPAAAYRRRAPRDMVNAVRLVAALSEDCGSCVQIAVDVARQENLSPNLVRMILEADVEGMPAEVALAYRFARSVLANDLQLDSLRDELRESFGDQVVMELSLAIAMGRVFPVVKRGMGFATACRRAAIEIPES